MFIHLNLIYNRLDHLSHSRRAAGFVSNVVLGVFVVGCVLSFSPLSASESAGYHFIAIELAFNILLIFEVLRLLFIFTKSVASSLGKQLEIISLILLRDCFMEIGVFQIEGRLEVDFLTSLTPVLVDAMGAVFIFLLLGIFHKIQKHNQITDNEKEQKRFVNLKKLLALALFSIYIWLGVHDIFLWWTTSSFVSSFKMFYTFLVIADIMVLLYALRFATRYNNLFRYSSYALATVMLRFSLSSPKYYNVLLAISAGIFVMVVTYVHNLLTKEQTHKDIT